MTSAEDKGWPDLQKLVALGDVKANGKALSTFLPNFSARISMVPYDEPDTAAGSVLQLVVGTNDKGICRYGLFALGMCLNNFPQSKQDQINQIIVTLSELALSNNLTAKPANKLEFPRRVGCMLVLTALQQGVLSKQIAIVAAKTIAEIYQRRKAFDGSKRKQAIQKDILILNLIERGVLVLMRSQLIQSSGGPIAKKDMLTFATTGLVSKDRVVAKHAAAIVAKIASFASDLFIQDKQSEQLRDLLDRSMSKCISAMNAQKTIEEEVSIDKPWENSFVDLRYKNVTLYIVRAAAYVIASGINTAALNIFYQILEFALSSETPRLSLEAAFALCGDTSVPTANVRSRRSNLDNALGSPKVRRRTWDNLVDRDAEALRKIAIAITKGLKSSTQVVVYMASRAAQTLFKTNCYAHPSSQSKGSAVLSELVSTLQSLDTSTRPYPTSLAILSAIIWSQSGGVITNANLSLIAGWPAELIEELLDAIKQRLLEFPRCCSILLPSIISLLTMAPEKIKTRQICDIYTEVMDKGSTGTRIVIIESLLSVFEILPPLNFGTNYRSWMSFQRIAMWLIGEVSHLALDDSLKLAQNEHFKSLQSLASSGPTKNILVQTFHYLNPPLAEMIKRLESVLLSSPWEVRTEAVRTMGKISLWAGEPYRLHISLFLKTLTEKEAAHLGLASASIPIVSVLKRFYYSQSEFRAALDELNGDLNHMSRSKQASFYEMHKKLLQECTTITSFPHSSMLPLGVKSEQLIRKFEGDHYEKRTLLKDAYEDSDIFQHVESTPSESESGTEEIYSRFVRDENPNQIALDNTSVNHEPVDGSQILSNSAQETASEVSFGSTVQERTCVASFNAEDENELTVKEGDTVRVLSQPEGGWVLVALNDHDKGYVPEWVIQEGETSTRDTDGFASPRFIEQGESEFYNSEVSPERVEDSSKMYACCNDFDADNEDEMSVRVGDRLLIVEGREHGWILCEMADSSNIRDRGRGLVPTWVIDQEDQDALGLNTDGYIQENVSYGGKEVASEIYDQFEDSSPFDHVYDNAVPDPADSNDPQAQHAEYGENGERRGVVVYEFVAEADGEMTVQAGDEVIVVEDLDDWCRCRLVGGDAEGLVPSTFIEFR